MLSSGSKLNGEHSDREILYKVLFDMRNDINDLKQIVFGLIPPDQLAQMRSLPRPHEPFQPVQRVESTQPVVLNAGSNEMKELKVEESLSLTENEKELIEKALVKHKGKRKGAARELGISERTLYRKIKDYKIED